MSTTTVHVSLLTPRVAPLDSRGARLAAQLFVRVCKTIGEAVVGTPVQRAAAFASSRGKEAAEVRRLALAMQNTDPGFAADLYAAAARHEDGIV